MSHPATLSFPTILLIFHYTIFCITAISCPDEIGGECGRCTSNMDPHITTFDNMYYDNHVPVCYKYVTDCPNTANYIPFEIYGCHYYCWPWSNSRYTCVGDISVAFIDELGNTFFDINIDRTSTSAAIDALTNVALVHEGNYIFDTIQNHQFKYGHNSIDNQHIFNIYSGTSSSFYAYISYYPGSLTVFLNANYFQNQVCGLCGAFDGDQTNELLGSDGKQYLPTDITSISSSGNGRVRLSRSADKIINQFASTYVYIAPTSSPTTYAPTLPTSSPLTYAPTFTRTPSIHPTVNTVPPTITDPITNCNWTASCDGELCIGSCQARGNFSDFDSLEWCCVPYTDDIRRLQITETEIECRNLAESCCDTLWNKITSTGWNNRIDDEITARFDWIEGCIRDVCLVTNDKYKLPCNTSDFMFSFASDTAISTAQDTYPILRTTNNNYNHTNITSTSIRTTDATGGGTSTSDATGGGTGTGDATGDDYSSDSSSSSDSSESMDIYGGKLVGNNNDAINHDIYTNDRYTINILFSNSLWYAIVTVMVVCSVVFWMCWVYKTNDNTIKRHIESDSNDVDQSNIMMNKI